MSVAGERMIEELLSMATEFQSCKKKESWKSKCFLKKKKSIKRKTKFASSGTQGQESPEKKVQKDCKSQGGVYICSDMT